MLPLTPAPSRCVVGSSVRQGEGQASAGNDRALICCRPQSQADWERGKRTGTANRHCNAARLRRRKHCNMAQRVSLSLKPSKTLAKGLGQDKHDTSSAIN